MKTIRNFFRVIMIAMAVVMLFSTAVYAEEPIDTVETAQNEETQDHSSGMKALAAAITVGLAAAAGAIGMGVAIAKSVEGISRQPEAEGKIRTSLMLGLVFVETAIIYALIIAVLIIFVL